MKSLKKSTSLVLATCVLILSSCDQRESQEAGTENEAGAEPAGELKAPHVSQSDVQNWMLIGGNDLEQHYSPLTEISTDTVGDLKLEWFADMPTLDGVTGMPLVWDGVVYQSGALGKAWANDARTGELLWEFDAQIDFPLDVVPAWGSRLTRGLAVWENTVLKSTGDCRLFALNGKTGEKIWEVQTCSVEEGRTVTAAPRVGDGKVFVGNADADSGASRPHVDAYDIESGEHLWRFYTIPGDPALGFESKAMEMASKTWGDRYWEKAAGGSAWEGITYDPRTDLVIIGVDAPVPSDPRLRGENRGDELFTNALVALKADTGEYVWHYTTTPEDGRNYGSPMPVVLASISIDGEERDVVMNAPKTGFSTFTMHKQAHY